MQGSLNILFLHSIGKAKFGGGEKWLLNAAEGLKNKGHTIYVGGRPGSVLLEKASQRGLQTAGFNILSDLSPYHVFKIASFIKKQSIDVLITRDRDLAVGGLAARVAGNTTVLVRHGLPLRSSFRKHSFLLRRLADGLITNTRTIRDFYQEKGVADKEFVKVIYNGIEPEDHSPSFDFKKQFPGKKVVLTSCRLAPQKGLFYLIDAIGLLKNECRDLVFFVLGQGKLYGKLKAYAEKKGVSDMIRFEGFVENVRPYLKGCDIFILPSLYEGMPNAAMEAMACGRPVVLTEVNGSKELVPDESVGMLIPPRDAEAIAGAVKKLAGDRELSDRLGRNARRYVLENFTVAQMISSLELYIKDKRMLKRGT